MIDIKRLRENPALFKTTCINKNCNVDIDVLLQLDAEVKEVRQALQAFATQKNQAGKTIAQCKDNDQRQQLLVEMSTLKDKEKAATETLET
jgi:seryl-tRNA synthetase